MLPIVLEAVIAPVTIAGYVWHMRGYFNGRWERLSKEAKK